VTISAGLIDIVDVFLLGLAILLAIPCAVLLLECLAAVLPGKPRPWSAAAGADVMRGKRPSAAVVIPAHDEQLGIAATVTGLLLQLGPEDRLLVVADNCQDRTAEVARAAGAEVVERTDAVRRGKGFALVFALDHLAARPPETVVIVDADCRLSPGALDTLARQAVASNRPAQGEYVLAAPAHPTPRGALSALAVLVRNRVRPLGLRRLGLPCQLTGSGMAFPWAVIRGAPHPGDNLVEDLVMGLELALRGHPPLGCPEVQVTSELPEGDDAAIGQRRRWEHGQLETLLRYGPRLLATGVRRGQFDVVALSLDLCVPPLALLVTLLVLTGALAAAATLIGAIYTPVLVVAGAVAAVAIAVAGAWLRFGRHTLPLRHLLAIPLYVLWKIPLYLSLLVKGKHKTWDRTRRKGE
jgi:cellulose synthase/poly-beta-1,6-N-acetylglucosamine synthase-like glycosyltransferase